VLQIKIK